VRPTGDDLLREALAQAKLAYQFAPGSYTFGTLAAIANAINAQHAPDWIAEFTEYEKLGSACAADPAKATPGTEMPTECV
jgi:hypothetical protein